MRRLILCAMTALFSLAAPAIAQTAGQQPSCAAGDPVVWGNTNSKVYHVQGDKYFGNTKNGQYLCQSKAAAAGYHASKSGSASKATSGPATAGATPAPGASPIGKHHRHHGTPAAGASPLPGGAAAPVPGASPTAKHHHHRKGSASPAPSAT
ncbi:MAG: hypothetical protein ACLPYS_03910 [Vulcanimicrobiaceae bacterium]